MVKAGEDVIHSVARLLHGDVVGLGATITRSRGMNTNDLLPIKTIFASSFSFMSMYSMTPKTFSSVQ